MKQIVQNRVIKIIIALLVFWAVYMLNCQFAFFAIPQSASDMKNDLLEIVTVCSVFAGFSFTVLGLLISLSSTKTMEVLKETTIMLRHCNVVADSIIMFIISTLISLVIIFVVYSTFVVNICSHFLLFDLHEATSSPSVVKILLNGSDVGTVTVGSDGSFSKAITLVEGTNSIVVTATDYAGQSTSISLSVKLDTTVPTLKSIVLSPNPVNTSASVAITLEVE